MIERKFSKSQWAFSLFSLALIIFFCLPTFYNVPTAMDLFLGQMPDRIGFWSSQVADYHWNGRYTASFLITFLYKITHFKYYFVLSLSLIIFTWLGFCALIRAVTKDSYSRMYSFAFATAVMGTYLLVPAYQHPNAVSLTINTQYYLITDAVNYQVAMIGYLFLLACFYSVSQYRKLSTALLAMLLAVFVIGVNEIAATFVNATVIMALIACWKHPQRRFFIAIIIVCAIASYFNYFSPGNALRETLSKQHYQLWPSVKTGYQVTANMTAQTIFNPVTWLLLVVFYKPCQLISNKLLSRISYPWLVFVLINVVAALNGVLMWEMHTATAPRVNGLTHSIEFIFLVPLMVPTLQHLDRLVFRNKLTSYYHKLSVNYVIAFCFLIALLGVKYFTPSVISITQALQQGPHFYAVHKQRQDIIYHAIATKQLDVVIPPLPQSLVLNGQDITPDKHHWRNRDMATYYGLKSIRTGVVKTS